MFDYIDMLPDHGNTVVIGNTGPHFRSVPERLRDEQVCGFRTDY